VQTGQAGSILPNLLQIKVEDASSNAVSGVTVTFADKTGLGTLSAASGLSNSSGVVPVSYQLPNTPGTYKVVATAAVGQPPKTLTGTFTETSSAPAPASVVVVSGNSQTVPVNTALSQPLVVQVNDSSGNPVPGVSVVFSAPSGTITGSPATTNSSGQATANYTTGASSGSVSVTASVNKLNVQIPVTVTGGGPATVTISGGNNQTATAGASLSQALSVLVADQYGNPVPGVSVTFSDGGAGGAFSSPNPTTTNSLGQASESYTCSRTAGPVTITATAPGVTNPATFTATSASGPAASVIITNGNNQLDPDGTQLLQALAVQVTDQYANPVAGVNVSFNDNGAGGTFSNPNPVVTSSSGTASQMYTLPPGSHLTIYINAAAAGVTNPAVFRELSQ
jgi:adhesin/invasin